MVHFPAENTQPGAVETVAHRHTPGPWAAKYEFGDSISVTAPYRASSEGLPVICDVYSQDGVFEANARLIAAAPDLLEALEYVVRVHAVRDVAPENQPHEISVALSAIAKATTAPSMGDGDE